MAYDPTTVAEWFIYQAAEEGEYLTQMKLQKLVYIAHGWRLGLFDKPLIRGQVEAWQWGPVIRPLYAHYAQFGSKPIVEESVAELPNITGKDTRGLLHKVWKVYRKYTAAQLSALTHRRGTPWSECYIEGAKKPIPNTIIQRHYKGLAKLP